MALADFLLQTNLYHSADAQALLLQTLAELDFGLAVFAEPYRIPASPERAADISNTVAITRSGGIASVSLRTLERELEVTVSWYNVGFVGPSPKLVCRGVRKIFG